MLLSHLHADHCLDLSGYYVMRKYHPTGPQPRIPVYGPEDTADRMARAYDLPTDPGMHQEFDFRTWAGPVEIGPFAVTPIPVAHPVDAFGLRVTADGATVAYSGDTGPCPALDDVARDADVFLAEASFRSGDTQPAGPAPDRRRRRRRRRPRRRAAAGAHPRPAVARPRRRAGRGRARRSTARPSWPSAGRTSEP